ncbi:tRNA lysidine(34) synthetase TilS [Fodinibius halophilus]|uniref:tRNA(Ile)-lysidine synthase n=1 Tax=Fodinibius halophilus TaxID=1736908 RepID=A0A6M1TCN5_9BACT|nr:tRNA lysidine(34) synthetase TilS [Fodinibius halophilus]NGP89781.1 tRNA lysidine(34) synthetase TilS [Fodinibius halophilus]
MSRSDLLPIEKEVRRQVVRHCGDPSSPFFIVAVSGGVDSMCLLYLFKRLGIEALVSHINYQKRGKESDKDAELVEQMAFEWGYKCHTVNADPANGQGENFQQWARNLRYRVFEGLYNEYDADGIAVAHHEDDQVETILQKIFRGAGLASWTGMEPWNGKLFRPLLNFSRSEIEEYADKCAIPYRTDQSNLDTNFARNLLRNKWLKKLDNFFPGWKKNVLRISEEADNYEQSIAWIADRITDDKGIREQGFHSLDAGLQRAVILYLLKKQDPGVQVSRQSLSRVEELADLQTGKELELTPQYSIFRDRSYYVLNSTSEELFSTITLHKNTLADGPYIHANISLQITVDIDRDFKEGLYLDADKIQWPITIRRWQPGDVLQPLGMSGHQKVADHLTNRKVRASKKNQAIVVESFEETICALIFTPIKKQSATGTVSEQFKCEADTKQCLLITNRT